MFWFKMMLVFIQLLQLNLNTSYVLVQVYDKTKTNIFIKNLNTSYVLVQVGTRYNDWIQRTIFKYIICFGSRLKSALLSNSDVIFKYIICFGSRCLFDCCLHNQLYLNTSYVLVQGLFLHFTLYIIYI